MAKWVIDMKLSDHLSEHQRKKLNRVRSKEKLSRKDWEELMGKNRDTYKRTKGGAIRRK